MNDPAQLRNRLHTKRVRYAILVLVSLITNISLAFGLYQIGLSESIAFAVALSVAFILNFSGCRWYVFLSTQVPFGIQFIQYAITNGSFRLLEYVSLLFLSTLGFGTYHTRVLLVLATSFVMKFFVYRRFVFHNRK